MKKIKQLNGMVIAQDTKTQEYSIFTKEEYSYGEGLRYPEFDGIDSLEEAETQARNYNK